MEYFLNWRGGGELILLFEKVQTTQECISAEGGLVNSNSLAKGELGKWDYYNSQQPHQKSI